MPEPDRALRGLQLDNAALANEPLADLWDALRLGPVYDFSKPGVIHVDLTTDKLEAVQHSLEKCREFGIPVPFDWMHNGKGASYGQVIGSELGDDGKWKVRPQLNALGRETLAQQGGSLWLSPQFGRGPLCHPETGEVVSPYWVERIALTPVPKQNRLEAIQLSRLPDEGPITLARFADSEEVHTFRQQLEAGALDALSATDCWVRWWDDASEESGTFVVSAYGRDDSPAQLWMLDWSRADGVVTVTNPRHAEEKTTYTEAARAPAPLLSRTEEAHMRNLNLTAFALAVFAGLDGGVKLSREGGAEDTIVEVPDDVADAFEAAQGAIIAERASAAEAAKAAGLELSRVQTELRQAQALAKDSEGLQGKVIALGREVEQLKAINDEREKAAEKAKAVTYALQLSRIDGYMPDTEAEREAIVADCEQFGLEAVKAMHARQIESGVLQKGRFKPLALSRPSAGVDGNPLPFPGSSAADAAAAAQAQVDTQLNQIKADNADMSDAEALNHLLNQHVKGIV